MVTSSRALHLAVMLLAAIGSNIATAAEPWKLERDSDGIKVYTRSVENYQLREFRAEVELATTAERVIQALKDVNSFPKWMPDLVKSELLRSEETEQYHYLEHAAPWPVSNRDGVYHVTYSRSEDAATAVTLVRVEAVPQYLPKRNGKVRISKSDGFWSIASTNRGVLVVYQIHADPGGSIPSWLANASVVESPFNTLKNLRGYIQSSR